MRVYKRQERDESLSPESQVLVSMTADSVSPRPPHCRLLLLRTTTNIPVSRNNQKDIFPLFTGLLKHTACLSSPPGTAEKRQGHGPGVFSCSSLTRAFRGGGDRTVLRKAQSHGTQDGSAFFCKHGLRKPVWRRGQNRGRENRQEVRLPCGRKTCFYPGQLSNSEHFFSSVAPSCFSTSQNFKKLIKM